VLLGALFIAASHLPKQLPTENVSSDATFVIIYHHLLPTGSLGLPEAVAVLLLNTKI